MASTWRRLAAETRCGLCGEPCPAGTLVRVILGPGWCKFRCATCAGETPPETPVETHGDDHDLPRAARVAAMQRKAFARWTR
jgi:hypothetical protein